MKVQRALAYAALESVGVLIPDGYVVCSITTTTARPDTVVIAIPYDDVLRLPIHEGTKADLRRMWSERKTGDDVILVVNEKLGMESCFRIAQEEESVEQ
jgi:hypothetical protein